MSSGSTSGDGVAARGIPDDDPETDLPRVALVQAESDSATARDVAETTANLDRLPVGTTNLTLGTMPRASGGFPAGMWGRAGASLTT